MLVLIILVINVIFWVAVFGWMMNVRMLLTSIADQLQYTEENEERRHRELVSVLRASGKAVDAPLPQGQQTEVANGNVATPVKQPAKPKKTEGWNPRW